MSGTRTAPVYVSASDPQNYRGQHRLVYHLAASELKAECGNTLGGALWWFVDPVLSIAVYAIAFSIIIKTGGPDFIAFLCVGTLVWRWFNGSVLRGSGAILDAAHILHKVYLHKAIFVAAALCADAFKFLITLIPLLMVVCLLGHPPNRMWLALPLVILVQAAFTTALVGLFAAVTPFFPDLRNMLQHILHLLLFVSGVFFEVQNVSPGLKMLVLANPMAGLIQGYRDCLLYQRWPDVTYLGIVLAGSLLTILAACKIISHYDRVYPKVC